MICPNCGSEDFIKRGFQLNLEEKKQRYQCKKCGKIITKAIVDKYNEAIGSSTKQFRKLTNKTEEKK